MAGGPPPSKATAPSALIGDVSSAAAGDYEALAGVEEGRAGLVRSGRVSFKERLDRYFCITARGSNITTELRAGLILFTTMCYIIVVNPDILSAAGISRGRTATATAFSGCLCTLIFSLYANLPFGSAPGMGLNTLFAYELVRQNDMKVEEAMACCLAAGVVFLLLGVSGLSSRIINNIPLSMKKAVVVGIGLFQTIVGLSSMGIVVRGKFTILSLGGISEPSQAMAIFTILLMALLILLELPGSILIGIVISMAVSIGFGLSPTPTGISSMPILHLANFDFTVLKTHKGLLMTFFVFFVVFIDTGGVMIGVAAQGESLLDRHGNVVNATRGYVSLGLGILISSLCGTSPMVIFLESAAAVNQGGRTGLTSLVASALLGVAIFLVPLIQAVPPSATTPVLVLVGSFMMGAVLAIPWDKINHSLPAYVTIAMIAFTCSITHGLVAGILFYTVLNFPFVLAKLIGWRWLMARLAFDEAQQTPLEKRLTFEKELERKRERESLFSLRNQQLQDSLALGTGELMRHSGAAAGWI